MIIRFLVVILRLLIALFVIARDFIERWLPPYRR